MSTCLFSEPQSIFLFPLHLYIDILRAPQNIKPTSFFCPYFKSALSTLPHSIKAPTPSIYSLTQARNLKAIPPLSNQCHLIMSNLYLLKTPKTCPPYFFLPWFRAPLFPPRRVVTVSYVVPALQLCPYPVRPPCKLPV